MKLVFGVPQHGWLPVAFSVDDYKVDITASNIPSNPVSELVAALRSVLKGLDSEVWWHEEPGSYYFSFKPLDDGFEFRVEYADYDGGKRHTEYSTSGSFKEVILPFWRALRQLQAKEYSEQAWPVFPNADMERLNKLIADAKEAYK